VALVVASIAVLAVKGINWGIEFRGGTEIQVKYTSTPDLTAIRTALAQGGIPSPHVTTIGDPEESEVYIRLADTGEEGRGANLTPRIKELLRPPQDAQKLAEGALDLNEADEAALASLLQVAPGLTPDAGAALAAQISERRKDRGVLRGVSDVADVPGMSPDVLRYLEGRTFAGRFAIRSQSYIGPTIGKELVRKATFAILGSLAGMLVYIWFRFQLDMGIAAVVALIHDTIVTLGLFSLFEKEMSLPVVAAFLTLIGYSVNDTVVIFDRIRENLKNRAPGTSMDRLINDSVNQTLSRTILTSLLTWLVVLSLFFYGGEALNPFSFVLAVGIVVGSYSTIYIASPVLVAWQRWMARRAAGKPGKGTPSAAAGGAKRATKVRRNSAAG
jgi:preprotein translocase subunit SecF